MADDSTIPNAQKTRHKSGSTRRSSAATSSRARRSSTWFVLAGGTLMLAAFSGPMSGGLTTTLRGLIANSYQIPVDGSGLSRLAGRLEREVLAAIALAARCCWCWRRSPAT